TAVEADDARQRLVDRVAHADEIAQRLRTERADVRQLLQRQTMDAAAGAGPATLPLHDRRLGRQPSRLEMWRKTSRAETTAVGIPRSAIGTWRKPPTAILLIATAIGSSRRRIT